MVGYRSIGEEELMFLLCSHNPIYGKRCLTQFAGCGCKNTSYGMVSFFKEPYKWHDKRHLFEIAVDLKNDVEEGIGTYHASATFGKTKIWTGRYGGTEYKLDEYYTRFYNPEDIISLSIGSHYNADFRKQCIIPFCKKFHIALTYLAWNPKTLEFEEIHQTF